jgi:hypothetical protein
MKIIKMQRDILGVEFGGVYNWILEGYSRKI